MEPCGLLWQHQLLPARTDLMSRERQWPPLGDVVGRVEPGVGGQEFLVVPVHQDGVEDGGCFVVCESVVVDRVTRLVGDALDGKFSLETEQQEVDQVGPPSFGQEETGDMLAEGWDAPRLFSLAVARGASGAIVAASARGVRLVAELGCSCERRTTRPARETAARGDRSDRRCSWTRGTRAVRRASRPTG